MSDCGRFIVALLVFAIGAGMSFYEGVVGLRGPEPVERPLIKCIVLVFVKTQTRKCFIAAARAHLAPSGAEYIA